MHGDVPPRRPRADREFAERREAERRRVEARLEQFLGLGGGRGREHDDPPVDAAPPEFGSLPRGRDAERERVQPVQRTGDGDRPEPVRVGLDHGHEAGGRHVVGHAPGIACDRGQIHLEPGPMS